MKIGSIDIDCPNCGQSIAVTLAVEGPGTMNDEGECVLAVVPVFEHTCPPRGGPGLPIDVPLAA
jgi:hypothetical protein